ncbi:MAG TPA: hypothetical protein VL689_13500 [Paraburkholderia sp.]|jgi:hypothetical protein|nr:hypothetical protein [Paraburkholderia sp.]
MTLARPVPPRAALAAAACAAALAAAVASHPAHAAQPTQAVASPPAGASASDAITAAEQLVFMSDQMRGLNPQSQLEYSLVGTGEEKREPDTVRVLVLSPGNEKTDAQVSDHHGAVNLPNSGLPCNPAVIYFLERDIADMEQLTGGKRRYFQQRVRLALAAGPQITNVTTKVGGKEVAARQIVVQPYVNDPNAGRFPRYTGKRYTFVFADDVPGHVAMIRTEVPGANGDFAHPLQTETLTYQSLVRKPATAPKSSGAKPQG